MDWDKTPFPAAISANSAAERAMPSAAATDKWRETHHQRSKTTPRLRGRCAPANANFVGWGVYHQGARYMRTMIVCAIATAFTLGNAANAQQPRWKDIDTTLGRRGTVTGEVHRYAFPRSDLHVTLDGVAIKPALALGGWVSFTPTNDGAMMMGDLVLLQEEINPVMTVAIENGLNVTAIHNHVLRANPLPFYMHVSGRGDPLQLATALHKALTASKTPLTTSATVAPAAKIDLDTAALDRVIGVKGKAAGGVYHFAIARRDQIIEGGMSLDPAGPLGVATGLNFQPTGGGKAAITGDFVLTGNEVNPVVNALRSNGIEVTAIHSHMLTEQPRLIFMHFWANDDAIKLARALRAAIDKTARKID